MGWGWPNDGFSRDSILTNLFGASKAALRHTRNRAVFHPREEVNSMKITRHRTLAATVVGSLVVGGALGAALFGPATGRAQSNSTTTSTPTVFNGRGGAPPSGAFKPIETKSHEANESAQREAQEDAGQVPTVP
jgi:hypothetical protein